MARDSASASIITMSDGPRSAIACAGYLRRRERGEAALEIGDQVAHVLEPDVQAQRTGPPGAHWVAVR